MNQAMIDVQDLQRQLGGVGVITGISTRVEPGQVIALLGKNGSGKTTFLETLLGFGVPSYGQVLLWGEAARKMNGNTKSRLGFVPQQDELLPSLTGEDHINLFREFRTHWNESLVQRLCTEWLIPVETRVGRMSVGQRQKLALLLAMAHEPELLVLDEPVASLDPLARRQFLQQLVELAADDRRTVIFSTHIVSDVERVANRVWMLSQGRLVYDGELDHLKESVVRLSIHAQETLPPQLPLPNVLRQKVQGHQAWASVSHWQPDQLTVLEASLKASISVEYLSLEDIFLEMNT